VTGADSRGTGGTATAGSNKLRNRMAGLAQGSIPRALGVDEAITELVAVELAGRAPLAQAGLSTKIHPVAEFAPLTDPVTAGAAAGCIEPT